MHKETFIFLIPFLPLVMGIPAASSCPSPSLGIHKIVYGDTMDIIARAVGLPSFEALTQYNPQIPNYWSITIGDTVALPYSPATSPATWLLNSDNCTPTLSYIVASTSSVALTASSMPAKVSSGAQAADTSQSLTLTTSAFSTSAKSSSEALTTMTAPPVASGSGTSQSSSTGSDVPAKQSFQNVAIGYVSEMCRECWFSGGHDNNTAKDDDTYLKIQCACGGVEAESSPLNHTLSNTYGKILVNKK